MVTEKHNDTSNFKAYCVLTKQTPSSSYILYYVIIGANIGITIICRSTAILRLTENPATQKGSRRLLRVADETQGFLRHFDLF